MANPKELDSAHKVPLSLVPGVAMVWIAKVLDFGRKKPGRWAWNWRDKPIKLTQYTEGMTRHIKALEDGQWLDPETGYPHLAHIAAGASIGLDAEAHGTLIHDNQTSQATSKLLEQLQAACLSESQFQDPTP